MSQIEVTPDRLEAWPGGMPLPDLVVFGVWEEYIFEKEVTFAQTRMPHDQQAAYPLAPEFYLRDLFRIDIDDQGAIERLISDLGFLFGRYGETDLGAHALLNTNGLLGAWVSYSLDLNRMGAQLNDRRWKLVMERGAQGNLLPFELVEETRLGLAWLRDLARLWKSNRESRWEELPDEWDTDRFGVRKPTDPEQAAAAFVSGLNAAMRTIHPFVRVPNLGWTPAVADSIAVGAPPLYSVIASQLYNHVAENADYKTCQNEACGRLFVRQVDIVKRKYTADYTSRPDNTGYCSPSCRHAQKQRKWRAEQKRKKEAAVKKGEK